MFFTPKSYPKIIAHVLNFFIILEIAYLAWHKVGQIIISTCIFDFMCFYQQATETCYSS